MEMIRASTQLSRECTVSSVVISHNGVLDLSGCLRALEESTRAGRILVIDNASTDDSVALARRVGSDRVDVVAIDENTGFAGGCNRGFALLGGDAEYIAFMNPDVRVGPECFDRCVEVMEANPQVGCVAPLLLRPDGKTVDSAGQVLKKWTLEVLDRGYGKKLDPEEFKPRQVLAACGALAVFRREALESVVEENGPWAENFFCFWEDLELGWRLTNAGWKVWFEPTARAEHGRGAGAVEGRGPLRWRRPPHLEACILTNRWMTLIRHLHTLDLIRLAPVLLVWDLALVKLGVLRRPSLLIHLRRRLSLVKGEWRRRTGWPRERLKRLPC
ncbi:MAG: glycosyltransferase family 2 protein [Thermoanaerobaculales bacterium]|nr:glycosyltransferase family 2 protein [Thermoanaerobaculales bacterium]